ncbi:MAG: aspartate-semialdehyde dehydrogenase, partial [Nostocaceae cyanobacterium CSU_2_110]|nr:aspartate-semialdehyde dehydrogenase [Nostocaceae cyanobacterium CSU_2_110]
MSQGYRVAVLGATGAVGTELLELLEERNFPLAALKLLASERSAGKKLSFKGENLLVEAVSETALENLDLVLASAGGAISQIWASKAVEKGAVVIDNSSAFRMNPEVPLIVPEVNPEAAINHKGIIANPNCTTILMSVGIYPLHKVKPIKRIVVATYQSASGAGARAMSEVKNQSLDILAGKEPVTEVFPYPLAFNLFPHNSP